MMACLLFSGRYILTTPLLRQVVAVEIVLYLLLTIALLRCTRDFGLERDYIRPPSYDTTEYVKCFHDEIAFRFAILGTCNFLIIGLALVYAGMLIYDFTGAGWTFPKSSENG
jgi:hypothetical protein